MRKVAISIIAAASVVVCLPILAARAAEVSVDVEAAESWTSATYDPDTLLLTNIVTDESVDRSYSFKWTVGSSKLDPAYNVDDINSFPANATTVVFPSAITYEGVKYPISSLPNKILGAFNYSPQTIKRIVISEGHTVIPNQFVTKNTALNRVEIHGETLKSIGGDAFNGCTALNYINLPNSLESFGGSTVFSGCNGLSAMDSIVIPWRVTNISQGLFKNARNLKSIICEGNVTEISTDAFGNQLTYPTSNIVLKGATPPTIHANTFANTTVTTTKPTIMYPANRAATYEHADFKDQLTTAGLTLTAQNFKRIADSSSKIFDVTYDGDLEQYTVHFNIVIGESDWESCGGNAAAYVVLYSNGDMQDAEIVSVTDNLGTVQLESAETPTQARLFVWADASNSAMPITHSADFEID